MARKKGGLNPEVQDDGGLFGDQMLVYEDDLKKAEETPARKKSAGGRVAKASAEAPVQTPLLPEVEESVEVQADEPVQETAPEESSAREIEEDVTEEARIEEDAAEASEDEGASPLGARVDEVMTGGVESDGQLTLARYASRAYLEYAMSVVKSRALPDVSDGQKPVQRRILIDMERMGVKAGTKAVKSARVVGDVLGKYHPHGDQSVYDALVRMAQSFSLRYPLIDGEGNFGSRDGDSQAAMRYTEARLMPIASLLLEEVDTGAIDFTPNYDGNFQEPVVLPAKLPFVLLNGSSGIAVGMATDIPSHNLREVAAACTLLIDKPEATLDEVLEVLPAPDFPCGGQIISPRSTIRDIYRTGRGKLTVRARYHFEDLARGQWQLVIDELPPASSSQDVLNQIEAITNPKARKDKKTVSSKQQQAKSAMLAILDRIRDESTEEKPVRLVFEPKSSRIDREEFVAALLSQTSMESNVSVNLVMLGNDGKPKQKNLLEIIREWIAFRLLAVRRRTQARLDKVNDRIHVLEGRALVLLNIDRVIEIIRNSDEPKPALIKEFGLTDRQADDILEIRLRQLARLAAIAIEKELAELNKEKSSLERILGSDGVLRRTVAREIEQAAKTFGDDRRTLIEEASVVQAEQHVVDEPVTVVLSQKGFLRTRQGHGHDCTLLSYKVGDGFECAVECRTVDDISFVTDTGRVYTCKVSAIPGGRGDGLPVTSFFDLDKGMKRFVGVFAGREKEDVVLGTSDGLGLKCTIGDLKASQRIGRTFVRMADGVTLMPPAEGCAEMPLIACLTEKGRLVIFAHDEIRRLSNGGMGVSLVKLESGERMIGMTLVDERGLTASGTGRGGKPREVQITRKSFEEFRMQRARKGRQIGVTWTVESIAPITPVKPENEGEGSSGAGSAGGLTIQLEDENPRLI